MELITVQHTNVINALENHGIYIATFNNVAPNRIIPYKLMMERYGWGTVPVFCSVPFAALTRFDASFDNKVILKLNIPEEDTGLVKYQSYYDWSDLIYYTECPKDINPPSEINTIWENAFKYPKDTQYWQATLPYLKMAWVVDKINPIRYNEQDLILFSEGKLSYSDLKSREKYGVSESICTSKCYRCGSCCKGTINIIPATEDSNLSPGFLEEYAKTHSEEELQAYILKHSEPMGEVCKWLIEPGKDEPCSCRVYDYRPSSCREYPGFDCNIGKLKMQQKTTSYF